MLKRTALAGLGLLFLASPLLASADTLSDLQAQIAQLLEQIKVLQQKVNQSPNQTQSASPVPPPVYTSCVSLSNSLTLDDTDADTDGDVSTLQQFLAQDSSIYPSGRITGYFGPSTLRAVQRWQASHGLASYGDVDSTGYGYVGPKTRAAMAASCGNVTQPTEPTYPFPDQPTEPRVCPMTMIVPSCAVGYRPGGTCNQECIPDSNSRVSAPVVNGIDGPASLNAGQSGTWTVNASVPNQPGAQLSYSVVWGDEAGNISPFATQASRRLQTSATFTHTYPYSGTYQPKFTVTNSYGSADASMTVVVGATTTAAPSCTLDVRSPSGNSLVTSGTAGNVKINSGESITVGWNGTNANYASGPGGGKDNVNGTIILTPAASKLYSWTFYGSGGTVTCGVNVAVSGGTSGAAIAVTYPDSGQVLAPGDTVYVQWKYANLAGTVVNVTLDSVDAQRHLATFVPVEKGGATITLPVTDNLGTLREGPATLSVWVTKISDGDPRLVKSAIPVTIRNKQSSASITVTAPNGGEQWEIGQLNTITWNPYGYNPDVNPARDVNVFLERLDGSTVGQIIDTGKASLHTYFNIGGYDNWAEPGQYRVYVANRVTGASDRSDAPFTLLPRGVNIKVNGSDGPVTLSDNQPITVSFNSTLSFKSCYLSGVRQSPNGQPGFGVGIGGPFSGYAWVPSIGVAAVSVRCITQNDESRSDFVQVNSGSSPTASLQITSPNGGEQLMTGQPYSILWTQTGLKSIYIALYKNDQWVKWIVKDIIREGTDIGKPVVYQWTPADDNDFGPLTVFGQTFKIYITGQKSDGSGYVDDKSDAPFGFVSGTSACTAPKIASNITGSTDTSPNQQWGQILSADQAVTWSSPNLPPWGTMSGNQINFTAPPYTGTYSYTLVATNSCGSKDSRTMNIIVSDGVASLDQSSMTSTSGTPTISGTASVGAVGVVISNSGGKAYGSGLVGNNGGRWSATVSPALPAGTYTVIVNNYFSNVALAKGTLTVTAASAASVDMKVNGSDGPLTLADNQAITVSLSTSNIKSCTISGIRGYSEGTNQTTQVPMMGNYNQYSFYSYVPNYASATISAQCTGTDGSSQSDSVSVDSEPCSLNCGDNMGASSSKNLASIMERSANLASSLNALEAALKALLQKYGR